MKSKKLILLRNVPPLDVPSDDTIQMDFQEAKGWFKGFSFITKLFAFETVVGRVYRLDCFASPFFLSLFIRLLSHGECRLEDTSGNKRIITLGLLTSFLSDFFRDGFGRFAVLRKVRSEIEVFKTAQ